MNNKFKISPLLFLPFIFLLVFLEFSYAQDESVETIRVSKLKIKGSKAIETKEIRQSIETLSPSIKPWVQKPEFDLDVFKDDILRIKELFANNGYYDAVVDYKLEYNDTGDRVKIFIEIDQGDPVILRSLNIVIKNPPGQSEGDVDEFRNIREKIIETIPLEVEKEFSPNKFEQAKSQINLILSNLGYPKHELESEALVNRSEKMGRD